MPLFIDTLSDIKTTQRFKESYGSYPVLRVHSLQSEEIGGRINTNPTAGRVPVEKILKQLENALKKFGQSPE